MTQWLLAQGHWAFVICAYAVSAVVFALDALGPKLRERALIQALKAQRLRQELRSEA